MTQSVETFWEISTPIIIAIIGCTVFIVIMCIAISMSENDSNSNQPQTPIPPPPTLETRVLNLEERINQNNRKWHGVKIWIFVNLITSVWTIAVMLVLPLAAIITPIISIGNTIYLLSVLENNE